MRILLSGLVAVSFAVAGTVYAAESVIEKRKEQMKAVGKATKAAAQIARGKVAFNADEALAIFASLDEASAGFVDYFPDGSTEGDTEAAPKIWEDKAGFEQAYNDFREDIAAASASTPADLDAFKASFGAVAENCKACHEDYRVKKN